MLYLSIYLGDMPPDVPPLRAPKGRIVTIKKRFSKICDCIYRKKKTVIIKIIKLILYLMTWTWRFAVNFHQFSSTTLFTMFFIFYFLINTHFQIRIPKNFTGTFYITIRYFFLMNRHLKIIISFSFSIFFFFSYYIFYSSTDDSWTMEDATSHPRSVEIKPTHNLYTPDTTKHWLYCTDGK